MLRVGRIKWDTDDVDAIRILREMVLTADSQLQLGTMTGTEYLRVLADVSERVDALEVKYGCND